MLPGFPASGTREKHARNMETWVGAVGVKGLIVEKLHCSFLSSRKETARYADCRWTLMHRDWRILCFIVLEHMLLLQFWSLWYRSCSVCKLFGKCNFCQTFFHPFGFTVIKDNKTNGTLKPFIL